MIYVIDGSNFSNLEEFWQEIEKVFVYSIAKRGTFGRNFSAFRELLKTMPKDTVVVWQNSKLSLKNLAHAETIKLLLRTRMNCHHSWDEVIRREIELAQFNLGETIFDTIVKIFVEESVALRLE
jgi:hypothetical protein